jgi:hypothetical protein
MDAVAFVSKFVHLYVCTGAYIMFCYIDFFVPTIDRSCGKAPCFTRFSASTKLQHNLQLAAIGSSHLINRRPVLKDQWNLAATSSSVNVCTTFDDAKGVSSEAVEEKVGVLLLNLGGPETLNDVQPFLFNLFADPVCAYTSRFSYCQCTFSCTLIVHSQFTVCYLATYTDCFQLLEAYCIILILLVVLLN